MRGPIRSVLLAALALCGLATAMVGQASAATVEEGVNPMLAIYGYPGSIEKPAVEKAIGGGLGRNFGFGANMLFEANSTLPRKVIFIEFGGLVATSQITEIGGTVQSGKTGGNNPLSMTLQFVDFQNFSMSGGIGALQYYSDTSDRPWSTEICSPVAGTLCKVDPRAADGQGAGRVKIEDVSVNLGPGLVFQGTMWGTFINGTATTPACISLNPPPAEGLNTQTLYVTQSPGAPFPAVGTAIGNIGGKACLVSANNYYYTGKTPEIKIGNN